HERMPPTEEIPWSSRRTFPERLRELAKQDEGQDPEADKQLQDAAQAQSDQFKQRDDLFDKYTKELEKERQVEINKATQDILKSRKTKQRVKRAPGIKTKKKTLHPAGDEDAARKHERK
ncbi:MAG: hypothetical protein GOV15_02180, partial [Candidatus Diapherotrites archaeon]|nr:hypothetical protein [Candidatus Diapherotrites archaeon]